MRRPAGVTLAAVILAIIALIGICAALLLLGAAFLLHTPLVPNLPGVRLALIAAGACILAWFVFCALTAVGLLRLRSWARYSILLIGALQFVLSAILCAGTILARSWAPPLPPSPVSFEAILILIAALYALFSLIGASWLVYFSLAEVRGVFRPAPLAIPQSAAPSTPELPLASIHTLPRQS